MQRQIMCRVNLLKKNHLLLSQIKNKEISLPPLSRTCITYIVRPNVRQDPQVIKEYEPPGHLPHTDYNNIDIPEDFSEVYRDFLPNPTPWHRNNFKEKLERADMIARRNVMPVPEFYVGTIMAVTVADPNASDKLNRFLGICIERGGCGLKSYFILRNIVDNEGVEIKYLTYAPQVVDIEIVKLEKREDDKLDYLRDCLPEYSYYPQNMNPVYLPPGEPVPVNTTKAELKPRPWRSRWERKGLKGVKPINLPARFWYQAQQREEPWEKYDLMLEYRESINENEVKKIYLEMKGHFNNLENNRRRTKKISEAGPSSIVS